MPDRIAQAGQALNLTAADMAAEVGLTLPEGQVWEIDTVRSTVPAGVTIEWDRVHGIVEDGWHGTATLVIFWASDGHYHDVTEYSIEVPAGGITPESVAAYLGRPDDSELIQLAGVHLPVVASLVEAYTRGVGFAGELPTKDLAAVVLGATARQVSNPAGVVREQLGDFSVLPFQGFTLAETMVLNRYRKRAS